MTNAVAVIPQGMQLPAHLQTAEMAAEIAAQNAAAAGGIKVGGFPKVSIEGSKFHEVDGGESRTYMVAAAPGQPPLPMMCLEAVIIAANPAIIKTYYAKKWQKGDDAAPDCQSSNGVTPDSFVATKQSAVCATCPQNQWGSKISEATGKEVKACSDSKQLVILPAGDLAYKALGLAVTPAALGDWGKFIKALSDRSIPITSIVTNITFDHTASFPKLQFAFNRFLTAEEFAKVQERAKGDDVRMIVAPSQPAAAAPALAAPAVHIALPPAVEGTRVEITNNTSAPIHVTPPATTGFGAAPQGVAGTPAPTPAPAPTAAPRTRKPRTPVATPAGADLSHLPDAIKAAVLAVGAESVAGKALLAQFPVPTAAPVQTAPVQEPAAASSAGSPGFAAPVAPVVAPVQAPTAQVTSSAESLKALLMKKLGVTAPAA